MPNCAAKDCPHLGTVILTVDTTTFWCSEHAPLHLVTGYNNQTKKVEREQVIDKLRGADELSEQVWA